MKTVFISSIIVFLLNPNVLAKIPDHPRICILIFTQSYNNMTVAFSCDGSKIETRPILGKSMIEVQSDTLKTFMEKMIVPRSCSAVNTTEDKNKTYQLTCILYP